MPDYTVAQMLLAIRKDHPEFAQIDDKTLFHAVSTDHPDLVKGAAEFKVPEQGVTDNRSGGQVAYDQAGNVLKGMWGAVTGIPATIGEGVGLAKDLLTGDDASAMNRVTKVGQGLYHSIIDPVVPIMKTVAPGTYGPATRQDWESGATAAGGMLGNTLLAEGATKLKAAATPERLQLLAEKAKTYRAQNPIGADVAKLGLTSNVGDFVKPAAAVGAAVAAPVLEKLARIRQGQIAPAQTNPILPVEEQLQQSGVRVPDQPPAEAPAPVEESIMQPTMEPAVPPHIQRVADALIRRGRGAGGADLALTNAQHLLEIMPEVRALSDVPDATGISPFDKAITNRLNTVGHEIGTKLAQEAVGKMVDTTDASFQLEELSKQASAYGDSTLGNKILKLSQTLDQSGMTDATQVITTRQMMFDSALDISTDLGRQVYDVFKDLSEKIAPGIKDLNKKYFTLKTSAELGEIRTGGISPESQMGAGTRPKADFRDRVAAEGDATKDAGKAATKAKADKAAEIRRQQKYAEQPKGFKMGPL